MGRIPWIPVAVAVASTACAPSQAPERRTVLLNSTPGVVVVMPMNVVTPLPEALEGPAPARWEELRAYLQAHGVPLKTVGLPTARRLWLESVGEARIGKPRAAFPDAARIFVAKLSVHSEFAAVLFPSLFVQGAAVSGRVARWDGTEHALEIDEGAWSDQLEEDTPFRGNVPAASLHAVVIGADGEEIHEGQAGLALLARVRVDGEPGRGMPAFEVEPIEDPFSDRASNLHGIARALDPWLAPRAPAEID